MMPNEALGSKVSMKRSGNQQYQTAQTFCNHLCMIVYQEIARLVLYVYIGFITMSICRELFSQILASSHLIRIVWTLG